MPTRIPRIEIVETWGQHMRQLIAIAACIQHHLCLGGTRSLSRLV